LPAFGQAQKFDSKFAGTYRTVARDKKTGIDVYRNVPPSKVRVLRLDKSGKWSWRDFVSGFDGTWTSKGPDLVLRVVNGPSGAMKNAPPMRLKASKDGKSLIAVDKQLDYRVEMIWDPTIEARLRQRYKDEVKRNGG
jgi:hypothetical protein